MNKFIASIIFCTVLTFPLIIKAQAFKQGESLVSAGYGFGNFIQAVFSLYESNDEFSRSINGPVFVKYEFRVSEKIGFGVNFSFASATVNYKDLFAESQSINWSTWSGLARVNRHFGSHEKFDPYIGLGLGYRSVNWKVSELGLDYDNNMMPLGFESTLGARYMFTPNIGLYSEVGIAKAAFQFGLNAKF
jgi:opacity protein-like surface antigen